jgi:peptide deformylase
MICEIIKDEDFLKQVSEPATQADIPVGDDLLETLIAHKDECVGMAANMIGMSKRIIAFDNDGEYMMMFNPEIIKKSMPYDAEEGCLSLIGTRRARRWQSVKVRWQNRNFQVRIKTFTGFAAQIIQHELDHCEGVVI